MHLRTVIHEIVTWAIFNYHFYQTQIRCEYEHISNSLVITKGGTQYSAHK